MKGYAHPIKGELGENTCEWCNESDKQASTPSNVPIETDTHTPEPKKQGTYESPDRQRSIEGIAALHELGNRVADNT